MREGKIGKEIRIMEGFKPHLSLEDIDSINVGF